RVVQRGEPKRASIVQEQIAELGLADAHRIFQHRVEYRLQFARRAADDLEHVGGSGLLLQRLAQLVEQPSILYRDDGLTRKIRHQLDLLVGERPHLLTIDSDRADQRVLLEHWYVDHRSRAGEVNEPNEGRIALDIGLLESNILDVLGFPGSCEAGKGNGGMVGNHKHWFARPSLDISARRIFQSYNPKSACLIEKHGAELGLADARRVVQHRLEYRLQLSGRTRDDAQYFRCCGLLTKCLAQFVEQPGVLDGDDGLRGEALDQRNLLVTERSRLLAVDVEYPDQRVLLEHRNA